MQARLKVGSISRYLFVNTQRANLPQNRESIFGIKHGQNKFGVPDCENGNAFHCESGTRQKNGHRDTIINYLLNGQRWQSTIEDYIFFHALEEEKRVAGTL